MIPMPKVMKKPATQPRTLHDHDKARIAKQTYSVNKSKVVFCQLRVLNLICPCQQLVSPGAWANSTYIMILLLELQSLEWVDLDSVSKLDVLVGSDGLGDLCLDLCGQKR